MNIRYKFIKDKVNEIFINLNINSYPIDILNVISNFNNCRAISYSKHMAKYNLSENEVIHHFGSDEGCTIYNPKKQRYLIFYNDLVAYYKAPVRRRWTLAHELGHILLNHLTISNNTKIFRNNLSDEEYEWMEIEANRFASLLLANPIILYKLKIKSTNDIMKICKLSEEASNYRFSDYLKWTKNKLANKYDLMIIDQFYNFIYKKQCLYCGNGFISKDAKYCPICGHNELIRSDGKMIYNDGFELDENGRAKVCPRCHNEQISKDGDHCKICGAYLINKCSQDEGYNNGYGEWVEPCGKIADGNARFCIYCGSETTFHSQGLLKDWDKAKLEIERAEQEATSTEEDIPDDIPF